MRTSHEPLSKTTSTELHSSCDMAGLQDGGASSIVAYSRWRPDEWPSMTTQYPVCDIDPITNDNRPAANANGAGTLRPRRRSERAVDYIRYAIVSFPHRHREEIEPVTPDLVTLWARTVCWAIQQGLTARGGAGWEVYRWEE